MFKLDQAMILSCGNIKRKGNANYYD